MNQCHVNPNVGRPFRLNVLLAVVRLAVLVIVATVAKVTPSYGQDITTPTQQALTALKTAFTYLASTPSPKIDSIGDAISLLESRLVTRDGLANLDDLFVDAIRYDADVLVRARAFPDSSELMLTVALEDLVLKAHDFPAGSGWFNPPAKIGVDVTIQIVRNGHEVVGYYARANPLLYASSAKPLIVFNNSPPGTRRIPAGNYLMWIEDSGGTVKQSRRVTISSIDDPIIVFTLP